MKLIRSFPQIIYVGVVIIIGLMIRLFFSQHAYQLMIYDMKTYIDFAKEILDGKFPVSCCEKSMGYPYFLAILFYIRGGIDLSYVRFVQTVLDLMTGVCVYIAAKKTFSMRAANIGVFVYMINPFTSAFVGLILPETLSMFLIGMLMIVVTHSRFRLEKKYWFIYGSILGYLVFVRYSLQYSAFLAMTSMGLFAINRQKWMAYVVVTVFGFLLLSLYSLIVHYANFHKLSIIPPYMMSGGNLYVSLFLDKYPEVHGWNPDPEVNRVPIEYDSTPLSEKDAFNARYTSLFIASVLRDPSVFIWRYGTHMFWIWDKEHVGHYTDPWYSWDRIPLRVVNGLIIISALVGMVHFVCISRRNILEPVMILSVSFILVITFIFPLVSSESRHSLFFYPLLMYWSGYGLSRIRRKLSII